MTEILINFTGPVELYGLKNTTVLVESVPLKLQTAIILPNQKMHPVAKVFVTNKSNEGCDSHQQNSINSDLLVVENKDMVELKTTQVKECSSNFSAHIIPNSSTNEMAHSNKILVLTEDTKNIPAQKIDYKQKGENLTCVVCGTLFEMKQLLIIHEKRYANDKIFKCYECHLEFTKLELLKTHFKIHVQFKPYKCTECHEEFNKYTLLKSHENSAHLDKFQCPQCPKKSKISTNN